MSLLVGIGRRIRRAGVVESVGGVGVGASSPLAIDLGLSIQALTGGM